MKHTKEPWVIGDEHAFDGVEINSLSRLDVSKGAISYVPVGFTEPFESEQRANCIRIVECVNAFANIENPQQFMADLREVYRNTPFPTEAQVAAGKRIEGALK